jgi:hypothetical protein
VEQQVDVEQRLASVVCRFRAEDDPHLPLLPPLDGLVQAHSQVAPAHAFALGTRAFIAPEFRMGLGADHANRGDDRLSTMSPQRPVGSAMSNRRPLAPSPVDTDFRRVIQKCVDPSNHRVRHATRVTVTPERGTSSSRTR